MRYDVVSKAQAITEFPKRASQPVIAQPFGQACGVSDRPRHMKLADGFRIFTICLTEGLQTFHSRTIFSDVFHLRATLA